MFTEGLVAGAVAGVLSGIPSTALTLARGGDLLASTEAAGTILLPEGLPRPVLLAAGAVTHTVISLGWGIALSAGLARRQPRMCGSEGGKQLVAAGAAAGLAIAALDLGVIGRRIPRIRALAPIPQVLDHLVYGAVVGLVLSRRDPGRGPRRPRH